MLVWFILAQIKRNNGIVDVAWGIGFVLITWQVEFLYRASPNYILLSIVTIWGIRLALHIAVRNRGRGEDWRYANWRKGWGKQVFLQSLLRVFLLQGVVMFLIALPLLQIQVSSPALSWIQIIGLTLWLWGFAWESIGDWQLLRFKRKAANRGKIMQQGLWRLSRHPNYFGEIILWWGIFLYCIPYGNFLLCLISPLLLTWLLNRVSGVPMLEEKYQHHPEYQEYVKNTNALLPKLF